MQARRSSGGKSDEAGREGQRLQRTGSRSHGESHEEKQQESARAKYISETTPLLFTMAPLRHSSIFCFFL